MGTGRKQQTVVLDRRSIRRFDLMVRWRDALYQACDKTDLEFPKLVGTLW